MDPIITFRLNISDFMGFLNISFLIKRIKTKLAMNKENER
jgi:hypothetical protein